MHIHKILISYEQRRGGVPDGVAPPGNSNLSVLSPKK